MATPPASATTVCWACGEPLDAKGDCVACFLRTALDESVVETKQLPSLVFGDFEVEQRPDGFYWELGHGAMGTTYLALDKVLRRRVALKVIDVPAVPTSRDAQAVRERFLREARAAAALRHPNVAAVYHFGALPDDTHCYYAMELVEGETLEALVRRDGPLDSKVALEIAIQITQALMAAAAHGLIHRDLKPGNIMLTRGGTDAAELQVKIIDFGLAKAIADAGGEPDLTHGQFVGTPNFASPEQFGSGPVDARSDIYSLGATLWFALTGLAPHSGTGIEEIRDRQAHDDLPVARLIARKVPEPIVKLLRSTLAVDPGKRPASARELMEALESCRRKLSHHIGVAGRRSLGGAWVYIVLIGAALSVGLFFVGRYTAGHGTSQVREVTTAAPDKSIAVLPLINESGDPKDEYFSDGLSEELIAALAQISELKVIGRSSSFRFKERKEEPKTIGEKLGVSTLLEGTVRKQGDRVRIVAELINAADGIELWTRTFDRELKDIFAVQEEIARAVAESLKVTLLGMDSAQKSAPKNVEAHNAYLQGHFHLVRRNVEDFRKAIGYYDQAIQLDSEYALAYAERAEAWTILGDLTGQRPTAYPKARSDAERAVAIAPALAEARAALGFVRCFVDWKFADGLSELKRAKELSPANPTANDLLARIIVYLGRFDEAERQARQAVELDPLSTVTQVTLARVLFYAGKLDEADTAARKAAELQPTGASNRRWQVLIAAQRGDGQAALREAQLEADEGYRRFELAVAQYVVGDRQAADAALADLLAKAREGFAYQIAEVYAVRGEKDKAFEWLQIAFDDRDAGMLSLLVDPLLRSLRDDSRYNKLLAKLDLPARS